jgi:hypothetical protein
MRIIETHINPFLFLSSKDIYKMSLATPLKSTCSEAELLRFACCFYYTKDGIVDWDSAAAAYDPSVKVQSFKTVTLRALTKAKKAAGEDGTNGTAGDGDDAKTKGKAKGKGGRKRKAESEEGEEKAPKKKGRGKASPSKDSGVTAVNGVGGGEDAETGEGEVGGEGDGE